MKMDETSKTLKAKLHVDDTVDYLEINTGAKTHKLDINAEDGQEQIKAMFIDLVKLLEKDPLKIELEVEEGYDNPLLVEVSTSYIEDLNQELDSVRETILEDEDFRSEEE